MKIAVCFSGQSRTWEKCHPGWNMLFDRLKKRFDADIDVFFHMWDINTPSHLLLKESGFHPVPGKLIDDGVIENIISVLNPVSYLVENEQKNMKVETDLVDSGLKYAHIYGGCGVSWIGPQYYSIMRSAFLKKKHEIENNFLYDMCIRMRFDLYFDEDQIFSLFDREVNNQLQYPKDNVIYPCYSSNLNMGDIFWMSNSVTFDRVCDFYNWLPLIGKGTFPMRDYPGSELSLYFYVKMLRINIIPLLIDPKIIREEDYNEKLNKMYDINISGCNKIL